MSLYSTLFSEETVFATIFTKTRKKRLILIKTPAPTPYLYDVGVSTIPLRDNHSFYRREIIFFKSSATSLKVLVENLSVPEKLFLRHIHYFL